MVTPAELVRGPQGEIRYECQVCKRLWVREWEATTCHHTDTHEGCLHVSRGKTIRCLNPETSCVR